MCAQDDIWVEDKLDILLKNINGFSLVHSDAFIINEKDEIVHESLTAFMNKNIDLKVIDFVLPSHKNIVTGCTSMFDSSLREKIIPIPKEIVFHDHWIALLAFFCNGINYVPLKLIKHRWHDQNVISPLPKNLNRNKQFYNHERNERKKLIAKIVLENIHNFKVSDKEKNL